MIRPRPTDHIAAEPFGLYTIHNHAPQFGKRAPAWCPRCGAKLSDYRSIGDMFCAPCLRQESRPRPEELHPPVLTAWERQKPHRHAMCPQCGGPMHRHAALCMDCHRAQLRKDTH